MNKVHKILKRPVYFTIMIISLLCLFVLVSRTNILSKLFSFGNYLETGYTKEVKSVELKSAGYDTSAPGAFNITKSAEWTDKHEVTVNFDINTLEIPRNTNRHIILVMDTSDSMNETRMGSLHSAVTALTEDMFTNPNNKISLITFDTSAEIKTSFTNDTTIIENIMANIESKGSTNYYLALKKVEELLSTYTQPSNTDTHLIFITDGYPTAGLGMYEMQYQRLLQKYPYLLTSAIQLEMGEHIVQPIEKISKHQYYAYQENKKENENLPDVLLDAARASEYYSSIKLTDFVNNEYFTIEDTSSIAKTHGQVAVTSNNNEQKIVWTIPADEIKSGTIVKVGLSFKIKLKEELYNTEAYLPTNSSTTLNATAPRISDISFTSTNTPVLQSWYEVTYNANIPLGCATTYELTEKHYPFDTIKINNRILTCPGSQFKGWEVADDSVTIISDESFIMPGHNTKIGAKWTELSINKSMIGTINTRTTLHTVLANASVPDNQRSDYVTNSYGISFYQPSSDTNGKGLYQSAQEYSGQYPVYYFRGNVENNNVIFGNYCWKILRTTKTGGIRMIYNGRPTNGKCTATGTNTTIGTSTITSVGVDNSYKYSLAYAGYMFGDEYETKTRRLGPDYWMEIVGLRESYMTSSSEYLTNNRYYSNSYKAYTATSGTYAGLQTFQVGSSPVFTTADKAIGKYTIFGADTRAYSTNGSTYYITRVDLTQNRVYAIKFDRSHYAEANGQDMYTYYRNKAFNTTWIYGNDVTYNASTGKYTLQNTISLKPVEYGDNIDVVNGDTKYHYTCMSSSSTCSEVQYVFADTETYMLASYITLKNGEKIENAVNKMIENPNQTKSSTLKKTIDSWYASNMTSYTYMLEDSPYCNNLFVEEDSYGGWKNTGDSKTFMYFADWYANSNLECDSKYSYTVSPTNGNGKLTYPVGTITTKEAIIAGGDLHNTTTGNTNYYLYNGLTNWTMSAGYHNNLLQQNMTLTNIGGLSYAKTIEDTNYIRPVITLKSGVFASDGDGTTLNPYIIEME